MICRTQLITLYNQLLIIKSDLMKIDIISDELGKKL